VTSVTDNNTFMLDDTSFSCSKSAAAFEPKTSTGTNGMNVCIDNQDDDTISARIGTLGLKTRFYRAMPAVITGAVAPGYVVAGLNTKFYWNDIGIDQQYIIGNNHPTYQVQEINGIISAISHMSTYVSVFTSQSTYTSQTNLNLTYTDEANGNVIAILPTAVLMDMYNGVKSDRYLWQFERDMMVAVNQDSGIRTWNGVEWSDNLVYKKIQDRIRALTDLAVSYDQEYGVVVIGYASGGIPDTMYVVGIRQDKFLGASRFTYVALPDPSLQPINYLTRLKFLALGSVPTSTGVVGLLKNRATTFDRSLNIDVPNDLVPATGYEIPWSFTTGDDIAPMQRNTLRSLEGNLYMSGIPPTDEVPRATTINITAYNDVGRQVTINRNLKSNPHYYGSIAFDTRLEGHRIRYKVAADKAVMVVNGMDQSYVNYDKASPIAIRQTNENDWQRQLSTPVLRVTSRTPRFTNLATGLPTTKYGTVSTGTGPDSRTTSSMETV
jgi:hypothetical protein